MREGEPMVENVWPVPETQVSERDRKVGPGPHTQKKKYPAVTVCNLFWTTAWFLFSDFYLELGQFTYPGSWIWSCRMMRQRKYSSFLVTPRKSMIFLTHISERCWTKPKLSAVATMTEGHRVRNQQSARRQPVQTYVLTQGELTWVIYHQCAVNAFLDAV